jgi:hypothetical protein
VLTSCTCQPPHPTGHRNLTLPTHPPTQVDLYSLGVVVFELWQSFSTGMERAVLLRELRELGRLPDGWQERHPKVARLIRWGPGRSDKEWLPDKRLLPDKEWLPDKRQLSCCTAAASLDVQQVSGCTAGIRMYSRYQGVQQVAAASRCHNSAGTGVTRWCSSSSSSTMHHNAPCSCCLKLA